MLDDPLRIHAIATRSERPRAIGALLERVGLPDSAAQPPDPRNFRRPAPTRGDCPRPGDQIRDLIVLDEALSALDVSVRAGIIDLLADLQRDERRSPICSSPTTSLWSGRLPTALLSWIMGVSSRPAMLVSVIASPVSAMGKALVAATMKLPVQTGAGCAMNELVARADILSRELDAAFRNRADLYRLFYEELSARFRAARGGNHHGKGG